MSGFDLDNETTVALGGVGDDSEEGLFLGAVEVIGQMFGPMAATKMVQSAGVPKFGAGIMQKAAPVLNRVQMGKASALPMAGALAARGVMPTAPISFPGSTGKIAGPFAPDYQAFKRVARFQRRLSFKFHKSGLSNPGAVIFTPEGNTQFLTLNPNAARNVASVSLLTPAAAITQIQYNDAGLQQLRLNLAASGFSFYVKCRNGTGGGLAITPEEWSEFEEQARIGIYNNGQPIDNDILITEIPTPSQSRFYPTGTAPLATLTERGSADFEDYYRFPSPMAVKAQAAAAFVMQRVPLSLVAKVNDPLNFPAAGPGSDASFTIGIMLHEATQESDWDLLRRYAAVGRGSQQGLELTPGTAGAL